VTAEISNRDGRKTRSDRTESLVESTRKRILEDIIQGHLKPGEIVQLAVLAKEYGVSRTPVREALALLERESLLSSIPYKGYLVRPIEPTDVHDIFFMRKFLEGSAMEFGAERIEQSELHRLRETDMPTTSVMTLEYDQVSYDFHSSLIRATGSARLLQTFESIYNDVRRIQYAGIGRPRADLVHTEHIAILDALEKRDPQLARQRMEEHIDLLRERALEHWISGNGNR